MGQIYDVIVVGAGNAASSAALAARVMSGAVFGRRAGTSAAQYARAQQSLSVH